MYTVEIWSNKECWEVQKETESPSEAQRIWEDCIMDGYNARLTYEKES